MVKCPETFNSKSMRRYREYRNEEEEVDDDGDDDGEERFSFFLLRNQIESLPDCQNAFCA